MLFEFKISLFVIGSLNNDQAVVLGVWQGHEKVIVSTIYLDTTTIFTRKVKGKQGRIDSEHGTGKSNGGGKEEDTRKGRKGEEGKEERDSSVEELDVRGLSSLKSGLDGWLKALDLRASIRGKRNFQNYTAICCTGMHES